MRIAVRNTLSVIFVFFSTLVVADFDKGMTAYNSSDYATAIKEFSVAAEQGIADAQYNLGVMYAKGEGVPEDDSKAVKWYRKAAEQGIADAQFLLGAMYDFGNGVPEDDSKAVKWYRKAAEQGHAKAQYNLGTMYAKGEGVPENYIKAYMWVSLAAAFGYKDEKKAKEVLKKRMSSEQIAEAQRLSSEWFEKYSQKNQN